MVVVVRLVVVVAREAASVVKVATAVDGEVVEEAKGGWRWCAHTPCAPNTHCGVRGGGDLTNLHAIGGVKKHRCLSRRNHRQ